MKTRNVVIIVGVIAILGLASGLLVWGLSDRGSRVGPTISTNKGLIRGLIADDGDYYKFMGIPYAVVNESNPFGPSTPHPGFDSIFDANEIATECPQIRVTGPSGEIQCLELDIYVPQSASAENRQPVLVWIHGGGWVEGSTRREGSRSHFLFRHDVIVVALNYRLGVFGFICADSPELPGNQGLKDQVLALRWINENIEAFGGDASRITVFGESAGGMSTNLHLYSPHEKLFDQVIIQSGPALSYWLFVPSEPSVPFRLTEYFGYNATDIPDAVSYLSGRDPIEVASAGRELLISDARFPRLTKPCIEKQFEGVEIFMPEHPMNVRNAPKVATTKIILGYNDKELGLMYSQNAAFFDNYSFTEQLYMGFPEGENYDEALKTIGHFYLGDEDISHNMRHEIVEYASDIIFAHSSHRMIKQFVEDGSPGVYSYVFSHNGERNVLKVSLNINETGAIHSDELGYLFDMILFTDPPNAEDQLVIDRMTKLWTNFVKYGDPTPETTDLLPFKWVPVTNTTKPHLAMNAEFSLQGRPIHRRNAFWDLFYRLYGKYQMWYKD